MAVHNIKHMKSECKCLHKPVEAIHTYPLFAPSDTVNINKMNRIQVALLTICHRASKTEDLDTNM